MKFVQAKRFTPANRRPGDVTLIVIHTAECGEHSSAAENVASWGAGAAAPQASWHYMIDSDSIVQSVQEKDIAWHAGPVNGFSIGVEHAGFAKQTAAEWADDFSIATLKRSAELVAGICVRHGIPIARVTADDLRVGIKLGICGHVDVTNGLTAGKGHTDPGKAFPWDWYLERVAEHFVRLTDEHGAPTEPGGAVELSDWVRVGSYLVAPSYLAPMAIGSAKRIADECGCELPTPELVDAIFAAADLKLEPLPRQFKDWTMTEMSSVAVINDQCRRIEEQIAGRPFRLLVGTHKDIVRVGDRVGLYGWHRPSGKVVQSFYAGHADSWIDYSQGLRLCRKIG